MTLQADQPLSTRVRLGTRADHRAAQGSGFLDALAEGRLPMTAYADLAVQHYAIYETLEKAAATMADDPVAGAFVLPELTRLPALADDLRFLSNQPAAEQGPTLSSVPSQASAGNASSTAETSSVLPATEDYCARLAAVAFDRSAAFVAHHYTRYLGDLSGGQYLGPAIAQAYGLAGEGHRFFVFADMEPAAFRARYRDLLDRAEWAADEQDEFLSEVSYAYRLNIAVLAELKEKWA
jgi:heme oxygenase